MSAEGFWQAEALAARVGGRWLGAPASGGVRGVGIDTRTLGVGEAYLAIRGERHDGHAFVEAALEGGMAFAVVDDAAWAERNAGLANVLLVDDAVAALQAWAAAWRDVLAERGCRVVVVFGSNGKTTTRHLLHHVLTAGGLSGTQSPKSFNNHLGLPLTLLAARANDAFVACEVGTNHPGEIAALSAIVRPDVALLTSIGREHLEHFGDVAAVAKEEAALLPWVRADGVVFAEAEAAVAVMPHYDVGEGVALVPVSAERYASTLLEDLPLPGEHHRSNAALVAAAARWWGLADGVVRDALRSARLPDGRMQELRFPCGGGYVAVIHDAYNANPDSMAAALSLLARREGRRLALLGDMLELGEHAAAAHDAALAQARRVVGEGGRIWCVGEAFPGGRPWSDALAAEVVGALRPGDTLLLKGSRGMRLERILPALELAFGPAVG